MKLLAETNDEDVDVVGDRARRCWWSEEDTAEQLFMLVVS